MGIDKVVTVLSFLGFSMVIASVFVHSQGALFNVTSFYYRIFVVHRQKGRVWQDATNGYFLE